nr:hypothetical protein [Micromonospora cremea]
MVVAASTAAGSVELGVTPDSGTQELLILLAEGGLAEVDGGDVAERVA